MATVSLSAGSDQALSALEAWLLDNHYLPNVVDRIVDSCRTTGTPTCRDLDREDEATATDVYLEALGEDVAGDAPQWGSPTGAESMFKLADDVWNPCQTIALIPPELDEDEEQDLLDAWDREAEEQNRRLEEEQPAPSLEPEPYQPTDEDWREAARFSAESDARRFGCVLVPAEFWSRFVLAARSVVTTNHGPRTTDIKTLEGLVAEALKPGMPPVTIGKPVPTGPLGPARPVPPKALELAPIAGGAPESDAEFVARLDYQDARERARLEREYPRDLAWEAMAQKSREWYRRNPVRPEID